jgi:hypothetical protein
MEAERGRDNSGRTLLIVLLVGLLLIAAGIYASFRTKQPNNIDIQETAKTNVARVAIDAQLEQTLNYQRCGHSVVRTVSAPPEWAGLSAEELNNTIDMAWRVTEFSPDRILMSENIMSFCPAHYVLMPDETGMVCIWSNRYGDGMERVYDTGIALTDTREDVRELIRVGRAFDTLEEAQSYIKSAK